MPEKEEVFLSLMKNPLPFTLKMDALCLWGKQDLYTKVKQHVAAPQWKTSGPKHEM